MWGYLLMSGDIGSVWALFGVSNQLMASVGLIIGTTIILRLSTQTSLCANLFDPTGLPVCDRTICRLLDDQKRLLQSSSERLQHFQRLYLYHHAGAGIIILISAMRKWKELLSKSPAQRRAAATETVAEQLS